MALDLSLKKYTTTTTSTDEDEWVCEYTTWCEEAKKSCYTMYHMKSFAPSPLRPPPLAPRSRISRVIGGGGVGDGMRLKFALDVLKVNYGKRRYKILTVKDSRSCLWYMGKTIASVLQYSNQNKAVDELVDAECKRTVLRLIRESEVENFSSIIQYLFQLSNYSKFSILLNYQGVRQLFERSTCTYTVDFRLWFATMFTAGSM